MLMKQTRVFTLTLSIRILVNTNQKDDFMRPRTCSRNGAYGNANEQYTLGPQSRRLSHRDRNNKNCTFLKLHKYHIRWNSGKIFELACTHPRVLRILRVVHKRLRCAPESLRYRTSHATSKECHDILRWFLDGKERLQRREHLRSEWRRGEAGGHREDIGKD